MSDEDSKFSFSERTRVDEGSAPGSEQDLTPQDDLLEVVEGEEDLAGKTGVLSSNELKEAGILDSNTPLDIPEVSLEESDSQTYVARTMMLDPSESEEATVAQVTAIEPEQESDATVAEITSLPRDLVQGDEATVALVEAIEPEPEPEPEVFHLVVLEGSQSAKSFEIREAHRVAGRHADCDLVIQDSSVSRRHFELNRTPDGYRLKDLGSGNGTLVNDEPVSEILLTHGMIIEAGVSRFQWRDPRAPEAVVGETEAEKTQMIDIAQLQHDPSFQPDRRPGESPAPKRSAPPVQARPSSERAHRASAQRHAL